MATSPYLTALVLAQAVGAVAYTISSTEITSPVRSAIARRSRWAGKLVTCPYCLSHWLAFGATAVYRPYLTDVRSNWAPLVVLDFLVCAMAMLPLAMASVQLIRLALGRTSPPPATAGSTEVDSWRTYKAALRDQERFGRQMDA